MYLLVWSKDKLHIIIHTLHFTGDDQTNIVFNFMKEYSIYYSSI